MYADNCPLLCERSFVFAAYIIDQCTEITCQAVFIWILKHYNRVLVIGTAAILTFCYTAKMPHYNFNVDILVRWFGGQGMDLQLAPMGCLAQAKAAQAKALLGNSSSIAGSWIDGSFGLG